MKYGISWCGMITKWWVRGISHIILHLSVSDMFSTFDRNIYGNLEIVGQCLMGDPFLTNINLRAIQFLTELIEKVLFDRGGSSENPLDTGYIILVCEWTGQDETPHCGRDEDSCGLKQESFVIFHENEQRTRLDRSCTMGHVCGISIISKDWFYGMVACG